MQETRFMQTEPTYTMDKLTFRTVSLIHNLKAGDEI